ncbi:hypothetical protein Fmac_008721 [Flemingia macrophylla]|uniref:Fe2OG dioxygenase domain-containing protein n=1 Tax=Flemingia macrophylla TaxID=520843 RepID=A0ABD1MY72_9FABA
MGEANIPTIDFSTFLKEDEDGKKKAMEEIFEASCEYGFFQIVNHEISLDLINEAMQVSKMFLDCPYEEKNKSKGSASCGAPVPHGYNRQPDHAPDKNEYFAMFPPGSSFNVFPSNPPNFRDLLEEIYEPMSKMGVLMESVINDCLGLPTNLLKDFNDDRSWDYLVAFHYAPAANDTENFGIIEHEDSNCLTFIISNEVEGLEIRKNGKWIPVIPAKGTIVVNIGDVIQVNPVYITA